MWFSRHPRWHFHKYGMYTQERGSLSRFQERSCTVCKRIHSRYAI